MADLTRLPNLKMHNYWRREAPMRSRLRELGDRYRTTLDTVREVGAEIEQEVVAAQAAGHSLSQIGEASGLSVPQLEYILMAADVQRHSAAQ
ncbi:MAG: hypothetical protein ABWY93_18510 [Mycobacterium sp.]